MAYCIILTTCPSNEEAKTLALKIVKKKLAACVQLSPIESYYTWKDDIHNDPEVRLLIKTKTLLYKSVEQFIKKHHRYDVPQIVQVPVTKGSNDYLGWIDENTTG